jgi:hypothetical protein
MCVCVGACPACCLNNVSVLHRRASMCACSATCYVCCVSVCMSSAVGNLQCMQYMCMEGGALPSSAVRGSSTLTKQRARELQV